MNPSSSLSLAELPKAYPLATYSRRLVHSNGSLGKVVNGDKIEFEFSSERYTLLATSYDYFEGCNHWIYLLSASGRILDLVSMPYVFGFTQEVDVVAQNEVAFGYFGTNDRWSLVVSERGYWSFAAASLARRMNRFFFSKRHLTLHRAKGAPWVLQEAPNPSIEGDVQGLAPLAAPHVKR